MYIYVYIYIYTYMYIYVYKIMCIFTYLTHTHTPPLLTILPSHSALDLSLNLSHSTPCCFALSRSFSLFCSFILSCSLSHTHAPPLIAVLPTTQQPRPPSRNSSTLSRSLSLSFTLSRILSREVGGWGRDPKKCTGRDWGMGSSTI